MAQAETPTMRPSLVALQVENLAASIRWYTTHLNFTQKEKKEFPDHNLRLDEFARRRQTGVGGEPRERRDQDTRDSPQPAARLEQIGER